MRDGLRANSVQDVQPRTSRLTYSVDSTVAVVGMIMRIQLIRIVVMMKRENNGCTKM